jgi:ABC-type Zn uptake system ZnuABC Zn-binding protein ZnuA
VGWRHRGLTARVLALLAALTLVPALGSACASDDADATRIVTTTAILADLASQVAGTDAVVTSLIPSGADLHSFEPTTASAREVARADVLVVNGFNLEGHLLDVVAENRKDGATVIVAAGGITPLARSEDHEHAEDEPADAHADQEALPASATAEGDPHMWLDPELAARYVETITAGLVEADAEHAEGYRTRGTALASELRALRGEIDQALAPIAGDRRVLVVFHDAFAYFAAAFDFELLATVLPTEGGRETSPAELAEIVTTVRSRQVPAIFSEPQFDSSALEAISSETGARVLVLHSDAFDDEVSSYVEVMRANARTLVEGLGAPSTATR